MTRSSVLQLSLALAIAACLACGPPPQDAEVDESAPEPSPPAAPQEVPRVSSDLGEEIEAGRDLAELLVCELVPGEVVAELLGGELYAEPSPDTAGAMWSECSYLVLAEGTDTARLASIRLYGHEHYDMARHLAEQTDETFEPLGGPGNDGFATFEDPIYTLTALAAGDVTLETRVEGTLGEAQDLAELVLDRLAEL